MNSRKSLLLAATLTSTICFFSCKKTPPVTTVPATTEQVAKAVEPAAAETPAAPAVDMNARAAKLGFAAQLPVDLDLFLQLQNGKELLDRLQQSKTYSIIKKYAPEVADAIEKPKGNINPQELLSQEVFIATAKPASVQFTRAMKTYGMNTYYQLKFSFKTLVDLATGEKGMEGLDSTKYLVDLLNDPEVGIASLDTVELPPSYIGVKVNPELMKKLSDEFEKMYAKPIPDDEKSAEKLEFELSGNKFRGLKVSGEKVVEELKANTDKINELKEKVGEALVNQAIEKIAKKNIVLGVGFLKDYVVIAAGSKVEDLKLAASPAESFAASDKMKFMDGYLDKKIVSTMFSSKEMQEASKAAGGISVYAKAIKDALSGNTKIDSREVETLLDMVGEKENALNALMKYSDAGGVAFLEDGLKLESYGGSNLPMLDHSKKSSLGALGEDPNAFLFASWVDDEVYSQLTRDMITTTGETLYSAAKAISEMDASNLPNLVQFQQGFKFFNENIKEHALSIFSALNEDVVAGTGNEGAFVIDLNGAVPSIPMIPQELVNDGKFFRLTNISPVKDRAKLSSAWDKINAAGENIMKTVSEMSGNQIPMPKAMSSQKNDLITWFIPAPFFNDDFLPSVTLNDKWFLLSTSKTQAVALAEKAATSTSGESGATFKMNFNALRSCASTWLDATTKNKMVAEGDVSKYKDLLGASEELDTLQVHSRMEGDTARTSLHLKTK